ncbi:MAG TPA: DAK2 domain-containing protein [Actinomycetota bacterium]|nr:DAK2 domain-containing protein [Actinomycetota bacterium]
MVEAVDARTLGAVMRLFGEALRAHREELNSLNVFPVPDGDTGTNMLLTQEAVTHALEGTDGDLGAMGEAIARASLMGARGNSGVILSQVLRGLSDRLCREEGAGGTALAEALTEASVEATRAVARPQPGTVLTVLDEAAAAARAAATGGGDLPTVAAAALSAGEEALARTPELLPELKRAGVVDAGGRGLLLMFDALLAVVSGEPLSVPVGPLGPVGHTPLDAALEPASLAFSHEVMYLLEADDAAVPPLQARLAALGDSLVVVGGGGLYNVHVHVNDPEAAVDAGRGAGTLREVRITSLERDVAEHCLSGQARGVRVDERVSLVAVALGGGLAELFRSLGARVVEGGPGSNPSVGELVAAIDAAPADSVLVLPNHPNAIPAAERAAAESAREVHVLMTRSIPQGIAAAAAHNPMADPADAHAALIEAAAACRWGELTRAVRDAETEAGPVRSGQWLALAEGGVQGIGDDPAPLAAALVAALGADRELLTVVTGADAVPSEAAAVEAAVRAAAPGLDVEVVRGGQPNYPYLIGIE